MRDPIPDLAEKGRLSAGAYGSRRGDPFGAFALKAPGGAFLRVIACGAAAWDLPGPAWDHVSVSVPGEARCPTWDEMCFVKGLFFGPDEWVVQFHPAASDYVNVHPGVLHLWRAAGVEFPRPPKECV